MSRNVFGHRINSQCKQMAFNVYEYFRKKKLDPNSDEYKQDIPLNKTVAEVTGLSEKTVSRIVQQGKALNDNERFKSPRKPKQVRRKRVEIDDFTKGVVRRKVTQFYTIFKKIPTLKTLNAVLREENILHCGREYLRLLLHDLGFKFKKCGSKRKLLIEQPNITSWRWKYLNTIKKYRRERRHILYLDETYVNASHNVSKCWQSKDELGVLSHIGKGDRLIIVHCGGQIGFVDGALVIFKSKCKTGDYHDSMNFANFSKWINEKLMPNIPQNSVIVMDNAAYHSVREEKKPTMASTKPTMQEWLRRHNVPFDEKLRKDDLYKLIKSHFTEDIYKIDEVLKRNGHEVLRLPPYHPDLNPIELVWGDIKGQLAQKSIDSNLDQKKEILERLFAEYPKEKWENCVKHVIKIEDEYCKHDGALDEVVDFIINVQDDSDDSDDGCFESEESSSSDIDIMDISD
ncbi:uncharacterized protein LOC128679904 [Plodia interpunctella]|uniref:uncharacterized protein LOC128679904 n=1 Tax=Plodia interpunctella TaxID=58824 RepID=UPI00236835D8|nr:uncharacterized protein LOC128679904 [Plodia interpunctella]